MEARNRALFALVVVASCACSATRPRPAATTTPPSRSASAPAAPETMIARAYEASHGGGPVDLVTAVDVLTAERCYRESACKRIGLGRQFATEDDCKAAVAHEVRTALHAGTCDTGYVDPDSLTECLTAMRAAGCDLEPTVYCDTPRICSP